MGFVVITVGLLAGFYYSCKIFSASKNITLKAGDKKEKIGVQDIAKVLKISASTVSRALNDHPRISKATKERVKQAAARLGYNPAVPELMNPEKTELVAVLIPSLESNFYRAIIDGIDKYLSEHNFQLFVFNTHGDNNKTESFFKNYRKFGISGIIYVVSDRNIAADIFSKVKSDALPVVTICEPEEDTGLSAVLPDIFAGVDKMVNYLKSINVKRVSLVLEDKNKPEDFNLTSVFGVVLEENEHKIELVSTLYFSRTDDRFAKEAERLLLDKNRPEAIVVKDAMAAAEVALLAEKTGVRIPDEMLLIGFGTNYKIDGFTSTLSMLKLPGYQMGYEAAELMFKQLTNPDTEKQSAILPVSFILKGSAIRL